MALPYGTTGSLSPILVPARVVAPSQAPYAFTLREIDFQPF